jgi:hypothetical protein
LPRITISRIIFQKRDYEYGIVFKTFFFKIIAPMMYLAFFAYAFAIGSTKLAKAWKKNNFKQIWFYIWLMLFGVYLLVLGGK